MATRVFFYLFLAIISNCSNLGVLIRIFLLCVWGGCCISTFPLGIILI